ncbi:substrate-binding periplasmic protein [Halioxenophilus sp. WMMB6]|uniref:substrate-binding periplasmic protein n=1 Tax=Halioxenophilus sp. WMMB6 TaxID=3073815 RepID=UPI00398C136F
MKMVLLLASVSIVPMAVGQPAEAGLANGQLLTVIYNTPGVVPFIYLEPTSHSYLGLFPDFLSYLEEQTGYQVAYLDSNPNRSKQSVIEGRADLYLSALSWLGEPKELIATVPFVSHRTYLYGTKPFAPDFTLESAKGARVCAREKFLYPNLERYFAAGELLRVDSPTQAGMVNMLARDRCDYAVYNNYNAYFLFNAPEHCDLTVYESPEPTNEVLLSIVLRADAQELKTMLDKQIEAYLAAGKLAPSLAEHAPNIHFPKLATCE